MLFPHKHTPSFPRWLLLLFACLWSRCESGGVVALNAKQIQFLLIPKVSERSVYSWTEFSPVAFHLVFEGKECWPETLRTLSQTFYLTFVQNVQPPLYQQFYFRKLMKICSLLMKAFVCISLKVVRLWL